MSTHIVPGAVVKKVRFVVLNWTGYGDEYETPEEATGHAWDKWAKLTAEVELGRITGFGKVVIEERWTLCNPEGCLTAGIELGVVRTELGEYPPPHVRELVDAFKVTLQQERGAA